MNYAPPNHVSFFNEVATRSKPSSILLISFFRELDRGKNYALPSLRHKEEEARASRSGAPDGRSKPWRLESNAPKALLTMWVVLGRGGGKVLT